MSKTRLCVDINHETQDSLRKHLPRLLDLIEEKLFEIAAEEDIISGVRIFHQNLQREFGKCQHL